MTMRSLARAFPLLFLLACGSDGDDQGGDIYDNDPNPLPSPTDVSTTVDPNVFPMTHYSQIEKPYEDAAGCLAWGEANDDVGDSRTCMCNNCLETIQECDALQGCREIRECSTRTGCDSEYSCYLLPTAQCVDVIDRWGNASVSVTVSLEYINCAKRNKCQ